MNKLLLAGFMALMAFQAPAVPALKIGIVNFQRAIQEEKLAAEKMKQLETAERALVEAQQKAQSSMEKKISDHQAAKEKLNTKMMKETNKAVIEKEAKGIADAEQKLSAEIANLQKDFGERQQKHEANIQQEKADLELKNKLLVESIARKKGFSLVLPIEVLPYVSEEYRKENDITDLLIADFNKAYPVAKPAAKPATSKS